MAVSIGTDVSNEPMSRTALGFVCFLGGMMFGLFIGFLLFYLDMQRFKREAVEVGAADFIADKFGNVDFIWKVTK